MNGTFLCLERRKKAVGGARCVGHVFVLSKIKKSERAKRRAQYCGCISIHSAISPQRFRMNERCGDETTYSLFSLSNEVLTHTIGLKIALPFFFSKSIRVIPFQSKKVFAITFPVDNTVFWLDSSRKTQPLDCRLVYGTRILHNAKTLEDFD